jgi:hypothetical protein
MENEFWAIIDEISIGGFEASDNACIAINIGMEDGGLEDDFFRLEIISPYEIDLKLSLGVWSVLWSKDEGFPVVWVPIHISCHEVWCIVSVSEYISEISPVSDLFIAVFTHLSELKGLSIIMGCTDLSMVVSVGAAWALDAYSKG